MEAIAVAAHLDVGLGGEDRVEMRGKHDELAARCAGAPIQAHHIALGVDLHILQTGLFQPFEIGRSPLGLGEGRGGDFGERDNVVDNPVMLAVQLRYGGVIGRARENIFHGAVVGRRGGQKRAWRAGGQRTSAGLFI